MVSLLGCIAHSMFKKTVRKSVIIFQLTIPQQYFEYRACLLVWYQLLWHRLVCQIFSVQILLSIVSFHSFCLHHNPDIFSYCFSLAGGCTWGNSCRFLHPGHNDKGMVKNSVLLSLASSVIVEMHAKSRI